MPSCWRETGAMLKCGDSSKAAKRTTKRATQEKMETKWLEDFVSLAETHSFSRSAQLRHVTQPAFSRRIQALEAWAGLDLVDRSSYPTRLTAAGESLHAQALDILGVTRALVVAQSSSASIAFRLAVAQPSLVRGVLSIDGGPSESASTPGMRKAFKLGGFVAKLAMNEAKLRHDVRREIVLNSGDTTWITDAVIRQYTAGQTADLSSSIDAFERMSKSKEPACASTNTASSTANCTRPSS